ncbi:hypothetical protein RchiOBHm_Chr3g0456321 [Rosa chinensis]|uniref:Uncharacterized protein n=1 Tax=Rosa chinensis TaxID=74649 RepID=A0A2P6R7A2_ROSCH|nr:hypothetical protein RchiOBHm_Chr3g0456321 [Rosa chinensis]
MTCTWPHESVFENTIAKGGSFLCFRLILYDLHVIADHMKIKMFFFLEQFVNFAYVFCWTLSGALEKL